MSSSQGALAEQARAWPRRYVVGIVWYTPEQWASVKAIAADPQNFEDSYEAWASVVEAGIAKIPRYGELRRVEVDADELLAWCLERDRPVDSQARVEFVTWVIRRESSAARARQASSN